MYLQDYFCNKIGFSIKLFCRTRIGIYTTRLLIRKKMKCHFVVFVHFAVQSRVYSNRNHIDIKGTEAIYRVAWELRVNGDNENHDS